MRGLVISLVFVVFFLPFSASATPLQKKPEFKLFINRLVHDNHFQRHDLEKLFVDFKPDPKILHKIKHPYEKAPWEKYSKTFLTQERVNKGVSYWDRHAKVLELAEEQYGVPANIIVAIVGVETKYGSVKPKISAFNALTTLGFYYPPRAKFFQSELKELLLLAREMQLDPRQIKGSYAGAIGLPQFMPSSYRQHAVSSRGLTRADLTQDTGDVVVSVANYLRNAGWHRGEPVAASAKVLGDKYRYVLFNNKEPTTTLDDLASFGVIAKKHYTKNYPAALLRLERCNAYENWIVFHNFYMIMRYNTSYLYAITVSKLADRIKIARVKHSHIKL